MAVALVLCQKQWAMVKNAALIGLAIVVRPLVSAEKEVNATKSVRAIWEHRNGALNWAVGAGMTTTACSCTAKASYATLQTINATVIVR
jgi:hypothetical protein